MNQPSITRDLGWAYARASLNRGIEITSPLEELETGIIPTSQIRITTDAAITALRDLCDEYLKMRVAQTKDCPF